MIWFGSARPLPCAAASTLLAAGSIAVSSPNISFAQETGGLAVKIQIGGGLLTQDTGIVPAEEPGSRENSGGIFAAIAILGQEKGRSPYGIRLEMEGNRADVGPPVGIAGVQTFGIVTIRVMGIKEFRHRGPQRESRESWEPFLSVGAGWNFHTVGTEIHWPLIPPRSGTPKSLELNGSPALRLGAGIHSKRNRKGLSVSLEGGWKWDAGEYRMSVQGEPDRRGKYNLSGTYLLFGILVSLT